MVGYFVRKLLDARQVRYTRLYERRADVIDKLYERLFEVWDVLGVWTFWLDSQTIQKLDAFFEEARAVRHMMADLQEHTAAEEWNELQSGYETPMTRREARGWVEEKTEKDLAELTDRLREDFREIIEISDLRDRDAPRPWWRRLFG